MPSSACEYVTYNADACRSTGGQKLCRLNHCEAAKQLVELGDHSQLTRLLALALAARRNHEEVKILSVRNPTCHQCLHLSNQQNRAME